MKKTLFFVAVGSLLASVSPAQNKQRVTRFKHVAIAVGATPVMIDSVNMEGKKYEAKTRLDAPVDFTQVERSAGTVDTLLRTDSGNRLHLLQFTLTNEGFAKTKINVGKLKDFRLYIDGTKQGAGSEVSLTPGSRSVVIKKLADTVGTDTLRVTVESSVPVVLQTSGKRHYTLTDLMTGTRLAQATLSPDGRYLITASYTIDADGKTSWLYRVKSVNGKGLPVTGDKGMGWLPSEPHTYYVGRGEQLIAVDAATGRERILAEDLPRGTFRITPKGDALIISRQVVGPKKDSQVYEITEPEDRQPGFRTRTALWRYDLNTKLAEPLTYGFHDVTLLDIRQDGSPVVSVSSRNLLKRPTTRSSIYVLAPGKVDTLVVNDGFVNDAKVSPNGKWIAIKGSPEALNGIGNTLPEGKIPNMYEYELFLMNATTHRVEAVTKTFDPSINDMTWSSYDGKLYFTAMNKDRVDLYVLDPETKAIKRLNNPEEVVRSFSLNNEQPVMTLIGEGALNARRLYLLNTKTQRTTLLEDTNTETARNIDLGVCRPWGFLSSRGDSINGRYYLPPGFDPAKKYPLIVYYYGGVHPTARNFESHYPPNLYTAQGYVFYVVNPGGAAGFGQAFASRHVNTAGQGVADDIIEGTNQFVNEHPFIDKTKIGCVGASYGGFMTQYLQTRTDLFAAAVSHAGISDHTSYWGEGYWGYSYSEVAMANSYPWSKPDLFVKQSPLYNADKIHTPILFTHGSADTNVPIGESIQLFTALKLLGRPTAFVVVDGENHGILDFKKRQKWQNSISAWFAKWLKGDSAWWDSLYPAGHF